MKFFNCFMVLLGMHSIAAVAAELPIAVRPKTGQTIDIDAYASNSRGYDLSVSHHQSSVRKLPKFTAGLWSAAYRWEDEPWQTLPFEMADFDSGLDKWGARALFARFEAADGKVVPSIPTMDTRNDGTIYISNIIFPGIRFGFSNFVWNDPYFEFSGDVRGRRIEARIKFVEPSLNITFKPAFRTVQAIPMQIDGIEYFQDPHGLFVPAVFVFFGGQTEPEYIANNSICEIMGGWIRVFSLYDTNHFEPDAPIDQLPPSILLLSRLNGEFNFYPRFAFFTKAEKISNKPLLYKLANPDEHSFVIFGEPE